MDAFVFVYGTLKQRQYNSRFMGDSEFIGPAIVEGFDLFSVGDAYPGMTESNYRVAGELYSVDEDTLASLDRLENEGNLYDRRRVIVKLLDTAGDSEEIKAWAYIHKYPEESGWKWYESERIIRSDSVVEWK